MNTGWNLRNGILRTRFIINLLGNEYWLELAFELDNLARDYKPTGK